MTDNKASIRSMKYDEKATKRVFIKLNIKTDADILEKLDHVPNKQGYIKELIRKDKKKD
jgi:hypothetical protein